MHIWSLLSSKECKKAADRDPFYMLAANDKGELCIVDGVQFFMGDCDFEDDFAGLWCPNIYKGKLKQFNNKIEEVNCLYPGLNLPLAEEEEDTYIYIEDQDINNIYVRKILNYFTPKCCKNLFPNAHIAYYTGVWGNEEGFLTGCKYWPISEVMSEIPENQGFVHCTICYSFEGFRFDTLYNEFDENNPHNIEFIEKFLLKGKYAYNDFINSLNN